MISTLYNPSEVPTTECCPAVVIQDALATDRKVIKITWVGEKYPESLKGYTQWSTRPYRVTDSCDGTRDCNAQLTLHHFCQQTGLDMVQIFKEAYPDEERFSNSDIEHLFKFSDQTIIPECNDHNKALLLRSLYSMNFRSLVAVLENYWDVEQAE